MKLYLYLVFILGSMINCSMSSGQELSVMTYNIRLDVASDGENAWPNRKAYLVSQIQFYAPDIFGTQEGLPHQIDYLNSSLPNYNAIGEGRRGGDKGEYSAIYYNKNKFKVEKQHTFWLSLTPNKVSKSWDAALPRICTYALFRNKETGLKFWVFNTHFDHIGVESRLQSVQLILKTIDKENTDNFPVVFMGDLNVSPESELITKLKTQMDDARDNTIGIPFGPSGTFNGFQFDKPVTNRIDYIFISKSKAISVKKYAVLSDSKDLKYPSDHLPVYVELFVNN